MAQAMFIRCKRKTDTFFVPVERTDSFLKVKEVISTSLGMNTIKAIPNVPSSSIMLYSTVSGDKELPDAGTISDHEIANDQVIFAVFQKDNGQWESIEVEGYEAEPEAKAAE